METLILTCLQAQLIAGRVYKQNLPKEAKNDLIWEIKQISPKECKIDAKVD
jgi:indole-3-glycerol phosphate synthase